MLGNRWVWGACYACCILDSVRVNYISEKLQDPHTRLSVDVIVALEGYNETKENAVL